MNKFGVIISTYMRPDGKTPFYLDRCLNSLKKQIFKNFKVYLIGDKYDDNNEFSNIVKSFSKDLSILAVNLPTAVERNKYLGSNNKALWMYGGVNATNHGIDLCIQDKCKYICMLDHDDWWNPKHLRNFNNTLLKFDAKFMCSKSTHSNKNVLPNINSFDKYIKFLPKRRECIKSSTCINIESINVKMRNLFELTGRCDTPADADLWGLISNIIQKNNYQSYLINEVTCYHEEEGYSKTLK
jgi:glycosyltransferase involved in cell wall biosynthesis